MKSSTKNRSWMMYKIHLCWMLGFSLKTMFSFIAYCYYHILPRMGIYMFFYHFKTGFYGIESLKRNIIISFKNWIFIFYLLSIVNFVSCNFQWWLLIQCTKLERNILLMLKNKRKQDYWKLNSKFIWMIEIPANLNMWVVIFIKYFHPLLIIIMYTYIITWIGMYM